MSEKRNLTCIGCPMGCALTVEVDEDGYVWSVTGNTCKRGEIYGKKEVTNPTRIVTTTVRVNGGDADTVSVRTKWDIPKDRMFACIEALKDVVLTAPVKAGDVVKENVAGTGVPVIATKEVMVRQTGRTDRS